MKIRTRSMFFGALFVVSLLTIVTTAAGAADILIIAHPDVQSESLDRDAVSDIYRQRKTKWDSGETIRVVMLKTGATHDAFVEDFVRTTPAKLKKIWKKVVFTGAGTPPKILKTEADLIEFVAETAGAIGYIDAATPHEEVKLIALEEK